MTTKKSLNDYIKEYTEVHKRQPPIFEIMMFENPDTEFIHYPSGKPSGFPYLGSSDTVGFYYSLDDAIDVLNQNLCDIRESLYNAAFILCRFPGLYHDVDTDARMYFMYDKEKQGFFQKEEPKIFANVAY